MSGMFRSHAFILTLIASVAGPLVGGPALASSSSSSSSSSVEGITVTGTGEVSAAPDTLSAEFGVETSASTVNQALESANAAATRMRDALVRAGIARADLQTSNLNIGTRTNDKQVITGYTVSEGLTAKIRNLPGAGKQMSAAVAAGGDAARLNGVTFTVEDDTALLTAARKKAFADARQKAELYAHEAGRPLGRVLEVNEDAPSSVRPIGLFSPAAAMDAKFPIEPGRQKLTVNVTVEWALGAAA
jgi:uncharacterized protein